MRVAAVAFVLVVGAAVVLAFANTLNSWVLGGLLGGLAAILLSIPVSLAIFTLLTRRQEVRQRAMQAQELEEEAELANAAYESELVVYEAEGYALPFEDELPPEPRSRYLPANRRAPVSGYLPLPPVEQEVDPYDPYAEDEQETLVRRDPRNYPRQPRYPARSLTPRDDEMMPPPPAGSTRRPATRSLAQHQSAALRKARQEAQQQRLAQQRGGGNSRYTQGGRSASTRRPRTSHLQPSRTSRSLSPREPAPGRYQAENDYDTGRSRQQAARPAWSEDESFTDDYSTEELRERYQQYPRRPSYPRHPRSQQPRPADPWTGELDSLDQQTEEPRSRRPRHDPERLSGNLRNPLVRRAPYLYDDDPLNEEFARQLDNDQPITRRSSLYEHYQDDEE